jgi:hypothetical protein
MQGLRTMPVKGRDEVPNPGSEVPLGRLQTSSTKNRVFAPRLKEITSNFYLVPFTTLCKVFKMVLLRAMPAMIVLCQA